MSHQRSGSALHQRWLRWRARILLACAALAPWLLPAQSSDTLGTKLTLSGETLSFRWDVKHPWSAQMSGAGVQLFAEYTTERQGRVIQQLDSGRPISAADPVVTLHLPNMLQATPSGNVCLYLQVPNGRRIPLRKSRSADTDTEHFAVPTWVAAVSANTTSKMQQSRREALESAVAAGEASLDAQVKSLEKHGWTNSASCEALQPPIFAPSRPADVIPAAEHEAVSRRVCIRRVVERRLNLPEGLPDIKALYRPRYAAEALPDPSTDAALLQYLQVQKNVDRADLHLREAEFAQYKADWTKWKTAAESDIRQKIVPVFGSLGEDLHVQDVTAAIALEIMDFSNLASPVLHTFPRPPTVDVLGYVGGGMETYTRCVHDGQDELAAKLRAWNEQVERAPMLESIAKGQLRTRCLNALTDLDKQKQQLVTLQQQLATERQRQGPDSHSTVLTGRQTTVLNNVSCSVR